VDVAYTAKPLWASYLAFMEQAAADGAFQKEDPGEPEDVQHTCPASFCHPVCASTAFRQGLGREVPCTAAPPTPPTASRIGTQCF
jgi:IMP cyclohydrolase